MSQLRNLTCSENPLPNFTALKQSGISGYLTVPHVGGGTANIEFEVLTGMNLDHFGLGEYPYTTVLQSHTCESIAANLKSLGMSAHALHNHIADFYDRSLAYENLGFDTFTPIEMMTDITRNPLGWAHDSMLTDEILSVMDTTGGSDFIFAVSVQAHGNYPDEMPDPETSESADAWVPRITVSGPADEEMLACCTYYVNQLYEVDQFIGELISALEERGEPCMVVFYGDHLPALTLTDEDVESGNLYQTEYAVWSNFPLSSGIVNETAFRRDLDAYRLSAYILSLCGIYEGDITRLHQHELETGEDLDEELRTLEYALLYDKETDEDEAFPPSSLRFGTRPPTINRVTMSGNTLLIYGSGFNEYSTVRLDGFIRSAELADSHTLMVENVIFDFDTVTVEQVCDNGDVLASTTYNSN